MALSISGQRRGMISVLGLIGYGLLLVGEVLSTYRACGMCGDGKENGATDDSVTPP